MDGGADLSEIDARLQALQEYMRDLDTGHWEPQHVRLLLSEMLASALYYIKTRTVTLYGATDTWPELWDNVLDQVFFCFFNYKVFIPLRKNDPSQGFVLNLTKPAQRPCRVYLSPSVLHWWFYLFFISLILQMKHKVANGLAETRCVSVFTWNCGSMWILFLYSCLILFLFSSRDKITVKL